MIFKKTIIGLIYRLKYSLEKDDHLKSYFRRLGHYVGRHEHLNEDYDRVKKELVKRKVIFDKSMNWTRKIYDNKQVKYSHTLETKVNLDDFAELSKTRQSVRNYSQKEVPFHLIKKIISTGIDAPSSCNRQGWGIKLINKKEDLEFLGQIRNLGFIPKSSAAAIILMNQYSYDRKKIGRISERRYTPYMDGAMMAQNILLAATAANVGTCCINMGPLELSKKNKIKMFNRFNIEKKYMPILIITFGYPEKIPPKPERNNFEDYLIK